MAGRGKAGGGVPVPRRAGGARSRGLRSRPRGPSLPAARILTVSGTRPGRGRAFGPRLRPPGLRHSGLAAMHALHRPLIVGTILVWPRWAQWPPRWTFAGRRPRGPAAGSSGGRRRHPDRVAAARGLAPRLRVGRLRLSPRAPRALPLPEPDRGDASVPAQRVRRRSRWCTSWPSLDSGTLAKLIHLQFGVLTATAVFVIARKTSLRAGVLAIAILAADPLFNWELAWPTTIWRPRSSPC